MEDNSVEPTTTIVKPTKTTITLKKMVKKTKPVEEAIATESETLPPAETTPTNTVEETQPPKKVKAKKTIEKKKKTTATAKRHRRKVGQSNKELLSGISDEAGDRLCRRAGIKRIQGKLHDDIRLLLKFFLTNALSNSIIVMESGRRVTLMPEDVVFGLSEMGIKDLGTKSKRSV